MVDNDPCGEICSWPYTSISNLCMNYDTISESELEYGNVTCDDSPTQGIYIMLVDL